MIMKDWLKKKIKGSGEGFKKEKSIYNFWDKEGFYIILFLCICIVATTAVWVTKSNVERLAEENMDTFPSVEKGSNKPLPQDPIIITEETTGKAEEKEPVKTVSAESEKKIVPKKPQTNTVIRKIELPVIGEMGMKYTKDSLVYSKTLEEYTTHYGVDIMALENTPVTASLSGEVIEVTEDPRLGMTISIAHEGSMITKYANLSTNRMVKVGDRVTKGQVISGVGKSSIFESKEEPHLHFEVFIDGKNVDPTPYLPN